MVIVTMGTGKSLGPNSDADTLDGGFDYCQNWKEATLRKLLTRILHAARTISIVTEANHPGENHRDFHFCSF